MNTLSLTNVTVLNVRWSAQIPHFGVDKKDRHTRLISRIVTPGGVRQASVVANYHMTILHSSLHKYIHIVHEFLRYICIYT